MALLLAFGAVFVAVGFLKPAHRPHSAALQLAGSLPTVQNPLPSFASQTTLDDAPATLGGPVVLPDSPVTAPSAAGAVWAATLLDAQTGQSGSTIAVTFPAMGIVLEYTRPAPSDGSAAHFQEMAQGIVSPSGTRIATVITLTGGVPALAVQQNSDSTGANFGEVIFNVAGTEVRVMGHSTEEMLQDLAQSILARSS